LEDLEEKDYPELLGLSKDQFQEMVLGYALRQQDKSRLNAHLQCFLFFLWLRHHVPDQILAKIFRIGRTSVRRCIRRCVCFFSNYFSKLIQLGTLEDRLKDGSNIKGTVITLAIDGSEQRIKKSQYSKFITPTNNEHYWKLLSSHRIIVENVFSWIKNFAACREKMRFAVDESLLELHKFKGLVNK